MEIQIVLQSIIHNRGNDWNWFSQWLIFTNYRTTALPFQANKVKLLRLKLNSNVQTLALMDFIGLNWSFLHNPSYAEYL